MERRQDHEKTQIARLSEAAHRQNAAGPSMIHFAEDPEIILGQFNHLLTELLRGRVTRSTFRPWEVELLVDIDSCNLRDARGRETLRRYQKAVQRDMDRGAARPLKLSDYLAARTHRQATKVNLLSNTANENAGAYPRSDKTPRLVSRY